MAKVTIKVECITQNNTAGGSNATFVVKEKEQTPGNPPNRLDVRTVVNVNWKDDTGKNYVPGKAYTVTIE